LRWLQRPRVEERVGGVDLDSMSERELERLYAGLLKLAGLPEEHLHSLLTSVLERAGARPERVTALALRKPSREGAPHAPWSPPRADYPCARVKHATGAREEVPSARRLFRCPNASDVERAGPLAPRRHTMGHAARNAAIPTPTEFAHPTGDILRRFGRKRPAYSAGEGMLASST
jgi:hypothetical protein